MKTRILAFACSALLLQAPLWADDRTSPPVPPGGSVTIPLDEYNHLIELAGRTPRKTDVPPIPYVLKRAELKLNVASTGVMGKLRVEGEVFNKGITKVPLVSGVTIFDAQQNGKSLPLLQESGTHVAVLPGDSTFDLALDTGLPISLDAGRASFRLSVPAAGSVFLTLVVPGDHTSVRIHPGLITNQTSENGSTTIEAILQPGQPAEVSWATREVATPVVPREVHFLSDVKTLLTVSEGELRVAALADISVLQGQPQQFEIELPSGYELTGTTGASVDSAEEKDGVLLVNVTNPALHSHQFLISLEKSISVSKIDAPFVSLRGAQRETGEILVEGAGTLELTASESGGLKRMDLKETNPYLRSMSRFPMQAAFRYHRQPTETPKLALEWTLFPDSSVLAAVVERAVVTTLVTTEGKSLTEIKLLVKNQAQPFLKLALAPGASILSADVAGEKVKPVEGPDGTRVPLLRAGFRPVGAYTVNFVYLHSGAPFAKKGGSELALPKMDVPINLLQWEVFLPEQYNVKEFGGDAMPFYQLPPGTVTFIAGDDLSATNVGGAMGGVAGGFVNPNPTGPLLPGQIGGYVIDPSGAVVPNARITITEVDTGGSQVAVTDASGRWFAQNLRSGRISLNAFSPGFRQDRRDISYDASRPIGVSFTLSVASTAETVEVRASNAELDKETQRIERDLKKQAEQQQTAASANVVNFQRKVSGVLPIRVDVPRTGNAYRFVRPLVLDEETKITFAYKTK